MRFKMVFLPPQNERTREWAERVGVEVPDADVVVAEDVDHAKREIVDADAAFGTIRPDVLALGQKLRWLQAPAAAPPAGFYYPELINHPTVVTNTREIYNDRIAAHIMTYLLCFARGFHVYIAQMVRAEWKPIGREDTGVTHLPDSTALIVGAGGIGGETARLCAAFGMRVLAIDARRQDTPPGVETLYRPDDLDRVLPEADFVIMTVPHTPQTEGMMNAARFRLMKTSAYFINIGRGMTTKLNDLNEALRGGEIAGAGLDVYEIEPLPPEHPLWTAPNVLLTPHIAGHGPYLDERRLGIIVTNAARFAAGQSLVNVVDKENWF